MHRSIKSLMSMRSVVVLMQVAASIEVRLFWLEPQNYFVCKRDAMCMNTEVNDGQIQLCRCTPLSQ
jgi:hypothetical protein